MARSFREKGEWEGVNILMEDATLTKLLIAILGGFIGALLKVLTDYFKVFWNTTHLRIEKMGRAGLVESFW